MSKHTPLPRSKADRLRCDNPIYASERTRPMKVLVLGLPRTGTFSLFLALRQLGFKPYHFASIWSQRQMRPWIDALKAKYCGQGNSWRREDFDRLLGDFDCTLDVPTAVFVEELVAAYPEAKVVLTNRDVDKWYESMSNTLCAVFQWRSWLVLQYLDPHFTGVYYSHVRATWEGFCGWNFGPSMKQRYDEHYELVRRVVPKERLLEYRVQDGWGPLCELLDIPVPDKEFPHTNDGADFHEHHKVILRKSIRRSLVNVVQVGILIGLPIVGLVYWWKRR